MKEEIKNTALIRSGIYKKDSGDGDVLYLQVKDFKENGEIRRDEIKTKIKNESNIESHLLCDGDLLFASKGTSNFCAIYSTVIGKAVASSSFFVIRVNSPIIDVKYLCWYLNTPKVLKQLRANAVGSSIPSITKQMLERFSISIPSIQTQKAIVAFSELQDKEVNLHLLIAEKKKELTNHILNEIIKTK